MNTGGTSTRRTIYLRFIKSAIVVFSLVAVVALSLFFIDSRYDTRLEAAARAPDECVLSRVVMDEGLPLSPETQAILDSQRCVDARYQQWLVIKDEPELYDAWKVLLSFAGFGFASLLVMGWVSWLLKHRAGVTS